MAISSAFSRYWKFGALFLSAAIAIVVLTAVILGKRVDRDFVQRPCIKGGPVGSIHWARTDVPVPLLVDQLATDWIPVIRQGAGDWSKSANTPLFAVHSTGPFTRSSCTEPGVPQDPVVFITRTNTDGLSQDVFGDTESPAHAHLHWDATCALRCVEIALPGLARPQLWQKITNHELGHALGLEHDDYEQSVMYWGGRAIDWGMYKVTEHDADLLRRTYGSTLSAGHL